MSLENPRIPAAEADPFAAPAAAAPAATGLPAGAVPAGAVPQAPPPPPPPAPEAEYGQLSYEHKVGAIVSTASGTAVVLKQGPVPKTINGQDYIVPGYVLGYFSNINDNPATAEDLGISSTV